MADFLERIAEAEARSRDLETQLSDPNVGKEPGAIEKLGRRLGSLRPLLEVGGRYKAAMAELADSKAMLEDDDAEHLTTLPARFEVDKHHPRVELRIERIA